MYLNDFRTSVILPLIKEMLENDKDLIFVEQQGISLKEAEKEKYAVLSHEPMFHRLVIYKLDLNEPLFCNPYCTAEIASINHFKKFKPLADEYHALMNSK